MEVGSDEMCHYKNMYMRYREKDWLLDILFYNYKIV